MFFRKDYVRRMVAQRKGTCGAHGCCFHHLHHRLLHRGCTDPADRNRCLRWDRLPEACRIYPFDEVDKNPKTRSFCNFYWEDRPG